MPLIVRRLVLAVILLMLACRAFAGSPLMLWEVSGKGSTVYLFGSIHVCTAACFPLSPSVLARLDASDALIVELDAERRASRQRLLDAGRLPPGKTLSGMLKPAERERLAGVLGSLGVPAAAVEGFRPWMAGLVISVQAAAQAGFDAGLGIDVSLMARSRKQGKMLIELESADRQVRALSSGSDAEQIGALNRLLEQVASGKMPAMLADLLQAWKTGDAASLAGMVRDDLPDDSEQSKELLLHRNHEMARSIVARAQRGGKYFAVIGAAHLVGQSGVPTLLAQQGFKVVQVRDGE